MPRLTENGKNVAMGIGGHQGSVNGALIPDCIIPQWFNDTVTVFLDPVLNVITLYNIITGKREQTIMWPANELSGGGDVWAAWASGFGLNSSTGLLLPEAGLSDVGPDGAIGYVPNRQHGRGCNVKEVDGTEWVLTPNDVVYSLQLLGNGQAIYYNEFNKIVTFGLPNCIQIGNAFHPKALQIGGQWWVLYYSTIAGVVFHPFDSTIGYRIAASDVDVWGHALAQISTEITKIVWSSGAGENPDNYRERLINIFFEPRQELAPLIQVPKINKDCWLVWFEFNQPPEADPPGNAILSIRYGDSAAIKDFAGNYFAHWVDGTSVEEIEQKVASQSRPCVAYWDGRNWPRLPELRDKDWIAIQAYCQVSESPDRFEAAMREQVNLLNNYPKIALVCQCYTSNASLTKDLIGIVPVFAKLARDYPKIDMLLAFSDQGRDTGLEDHPEVYPYWVDLFSGITGEPEMPDEPETQLPAEICSALHTERAKYGESPNDAELAQILNDTAWQFPPEWGLSRKESGNHAESPERPGLGKVARDILHHKSSNLIWDVLGAAGDGGPATPQCHESIGEMEDPNRPWVAPVKPPDATDPTPGEVIILHFDSVVHRSDPNGMLIRFDVQATHPVIEILVDLEGDGEPGIPIGFKNEPRVDGRYCRALAFKPTVNGTWPLRVTAKDSAGNEYQSDGSHLVTVTF